MKPLRALPSVLLLALALCACEMRSTFNKQKWEEQVDRSYPHRNDMLDHLLRTTDFKGKTIAEVFEILGGHDDWCDHNRYELIYSVLVDRDPENDLLHGKNLVFELDRTDTLIDSSTVIVNLRVDEWTQ